MSGALPQPVSLGEITGYAQLRGFDEPEAAFMMFVEVMRSVDSEYLALRYKQIESRVSAAVKAAKADGRRRG